MLPLVHTVSNVLCCCCCVTSLGECGSGWMMNKLSDGYKFFFNVHSLAYSFERGDGVKKDYALLTRDEIQVTDTHRPHYCQTPPLNVRRRPMGTCVCLVVNVVEPSM